MKWVDTDFISDIDSLSFSSDGYHSSFFKREIDGEMYWGKVFNDPDDSKREIIDRFQGLIL